MDSQRIIQLYNNVLEYDLFRYNLPIESVITGIESMNEVYKPDNVSLKAKEYNLADYNNAAYRCAYLHKYAAFHTVMVQDMMYEAVRMNYRFFYDIVHSYDRFNICCLGGGPGTDAVGVLAALHSVFSYFHTAVSIVDYMVNWRHSFASILQELGSGFYGAFGSNAYHFLRWRYIGANLLQPLTPEVLDAVGSASLVTMIKFASAAACVDTETMTQNIFSAMRPGAVLLFIDNDGGGFHELIKKVALEHNFLSIFGPFRHENYTNETMKIKRFGYMSCFKSTITVHVLQKPPELPIPYFSHDFNSSYASPFDLNPYRRVIVDPAVENYYPPLENSHVPFMTPVPSAGSNLDFSIDENIQDPNNFQSPQNVIPQSPGLGPLQSYVATPVTVNVINSPADLEHVKPINCTPVRKSKGRKRKKLSPGCFPLKHLRQQLSRKFHQVKYRASSLLGQRRSKAKNTHPVFRL